MSTGKLTTNQAWRYIAEEFLKADAGEAEFGVPTSGLCIATGHLADKGIITIKQEGEMDNTSLALMREHKRIGYLVQASDEIEAGVDATVIRATLALIFAEAANV